MGAKSPPGQVKYIDFRGFQVKRVLSPPLERKKCTPPLDKFLNTPLISSLSSFHPFY